jgi:hypothetical protein
MDARPAVAAHRGEKGERECAEDALARAGEVGRGRL